MALPTKIVQIVDLRLSARWNAAIKSTMRAVMVKILLITEKLPFQIRGRPKESLIQELAAYASDESFNEWMRNWNMGHTFDVIDFKNA